ncbi:MAG: Rrf2 family transcriptional regulator [Chitinophagales bacterium]|nr:Rrf2 family transcriptional regulator [Chitinophagales bacterium]
MFSNACKYGLRAVTYIAAQSLDGNRVNISAIAENAGCPEAFIGKILSALTKQKIVSSYKGIQGGFEISESSMHAIKVGDIVDAIDGSTAYNSCALGFSKCDPNNPCPLHSKFSSIRDNLKMMLKTTSVYDLAIDLKSGKASLLKTISSN